MLHIPSRVALAARAFLYNSNVSRLPLSSDVDVMSQRTLPRLPAYHMKAICEASARRSACD